MNVHYELLGLEELGRPATPHDSSMEQFRLQLHNIESGASDLGLDPQTIHLAAELAAFDPELDSYQRIALILLIVISLASVEEGSTRFPVTGPESVQPMRRLLAPLCGSAFGDNAVETMRSAIELLLTSGDASGVVGTAPSDYKPLLYLAPYVYQHRFLSAEIRFARQMATLINADPSPLSPDDSGSVDHRHLSSEQLKAVAGAVTSPISIISGGPGTGKTSIIIEIAEALIARGVKPSRIAFAAPTGKAAYRIGESIRQSIARKTDRSLRVKDCPPPSTIHRLLHYSPASRRFLYHRNNPLAADAVIVDEASMLDLDLVSRLIDALRPGARLILLGDADQLPSVSAGAVFRDLLPRVEESEPAPLANNCVRLSYSYRTSIENDGIAIFKLANAIKTGDKAFLSNESQDGTIVSCDSAQQISFTGAEWLEGQGMVGAFLERWYEKHIGCRDRAFNLEKQIFDSVDHGFASTECESIGRIVLNLSNSRILSVTRVLDDGSERVNELLHRRKAHEVGVSAERERFIAGEPVIVLRNDYERMLFNGDQGVVLWVRRPGAEPMRMAVFPRGDNFVAFNLDALRDRLELCYAMTVHKAQGSEFDAVALMLPEKDHPILTRELVYTAVSRARRSVIVVGSRAVLESAVARRIERYSGVRERLAECLKPSLRA